MQLLKFKGNRVPLLVPKVRPAIGLRQYTCVLLPGVCLRLPATTQVIGDAETEGPEAARRRRRKKKSFRRFTIFMSFARLGSYVSSFQQHGWEASVAGVFNCNMPPPTRENARRRRRSEMFLLYACFAASQSTAFFVFGLFVPLLTVRKITNPPAGSDAPRYRCLIEAGVFSLAETGPVLPKVFLHL